MGVNRTYLSKLEKAATYPGLEIIAKLVTVPEVALAGRWADQAEKGLEGRGAGRACEASRSTPLVHQRCGGSRRAEGAGQAGRGSDALRW